MTTLNTHTQRTAHELFRRHVKGSNFMTPNVIRFDWAGDLAYELSSGTGLDYGTIIYGITVVSETGQEHDLSKCLHSEKEVAEYIDNLNRLSGGMITREEFIARTNPDEEEEGS